MSYRILIVDDSKTTRKMIARSLKMARIPVEEFVEAGNGQEGLEALDAGDIDIVFSDLNMPVMTGFEMIDRIKQGSVYCNVPLIVISTEGSAMRIAALKNQGINGYIRKPFRPEEVRDVVWQVVKESLKND